SLYRPVLQLRRIIEYLKSGGLDVNRFQIRLNGNQYPRNLETARPGEAPNFRNNPAGNRIEFNFTNTENLPVRFGVPYVSIPEDSTQISPYRRWQSDTEGLYFRIKLEETGQLLKGRD